MTDTNGISRRGAIALAGMGTAGLALAGCDKSQKGGGTELKTFGKYEPYGIEPNLANLPGQQVPAEFPTFAPEYITIVRISSRSEWGLTVNHASFKAKGLDRNGRLKLASDVIKDIAPGAQTRKRLKQANPSFRPHMRATGNFMNETDIVSFADFGSNQQVELFVWLDDQSPGNPAIKGDVQIDPTYLISFAPMTIASKRAEPNDSFIARPVSIGGLNGAVFAIENYFCTYNTESLKYEVDRPQQAGATPKIFAMNFHFTVPNTDLNPQQHSLKRIPMVIDPDTGNGVGYEP